VHTTNGGEKMKDFVEAQGISYPVALDVDSTTTGAFAVDSYPDYYLIDRSGNLRVADIANKDLERAVQVLLAERGDRPAALAKAFGTAKKKDKRVLVVWGDEGERREVDALLKSSERGTLVRYEYEVVRLERGPNADLAMTLSAGAAGAALTAMDASGSLLGTADARGIDAERLEAFLEQHRVPVRDAEKIWSDALARAQREKKNLLVHIGAPW
jgi:hypothetical protein